MPTNLLEVVEKEEKSPENEESLSRKMRNLQ